MGLDIYAYRDVVPSDDQSEGRRFFVNSHFADRALPIRDDVLYTTGGTFSFRAGSYSGYNEWRNQLAKLGGYVPREPDPRDQESGPRHDRGAWDATDGPFWELINFSDAEGTIGSLVAEKLVRDFQEFDAAALKFFGEYGYGIYRSFWRAFALATYNGAVEFC